MSLGSALKKVLGFVAGILIPGASQSTTDLTHAIQQELANAFGQRRALEAARLRVQPGRASALTNAPTANLG